MKKENGRPGRAAVKATQKAARAKPIIPENAVYASALSALKSEAVLNGSARLTVFYTDGKATGFTCGHSNNRRAAGGDNE